MRVIDVRCRKIGLTLRYRQRGEKKDSDNHSSASHRFLPENISNVRKFSTPLIDIFTFFTVALFLAYEIVRANNRCVLLLNGNR